MFGEREKPLKIRVSSHERRNELKPVWDFISISLSFRFWSAFYLCSHELRRNESQTGMDFISVMKSQTGMRFSLEQNLPESKWISADSLVTAFNAHVRLKLIAGVISLRSFWQNDRSEITHAIRLIKYHVNTSRNEMPTHVHVYVL